MDYCNCIKIGKSVNQSVLTNAISNRRNGDRWFRFPPHPFWSTAPPGALCRSLHVCSAASVFHAACVCVTVVWNSAVTGISAAAPDGIRGRCQHKESLAEGNSLVISIAAYEITLCSNKKHCIITSGGYAI